MKETELKQYKHEEKERNYNWVSKRHSGSDKNAGTFLDWNEKKIRNQQVIDFQEDVLRVLKAVSEIDFINLDSN